MKALLAVAFVLAMPAVDLPPPGAPFTFHFAPAEGKTWVETERRTRTTRVGKLPPRIIQEVSRLRVTVHREKHGWRFDHRVIALSVKHNGHDQSAVFKGLAGAIVTLHADAQGKLTRVEGLDTIVRGIANGLPALAGFAAEALTDKQRIEDEIRKEWTDRITEFAGKQARVDQVWFGSSTLSTGQGPLLYHSATRVMERLTHGGAACVRMRFVSHVDPTALAKVSPEAVARAQALIQAPNAPTDVEFSSEGERIVEPATLYLHRERIIKTTKVWVDMPLVGRTAIVEEDQAETTCTY